MSQTRYYWMILLTKLCLILYVHLSTFLWCFYSDQSFIILHNLFIFLQPHTAIFPQSFSFQNKSDTSLGNKKLLPTTFSWYTRGAWTVSASLLDVCILNTFSSRIGLFYNNWRLIIKVTRIEGNGKSQKTGDLLFITPAIYDLLN